MQTQESIGKGPLIRPAIDHDTVRQARKMPEITERATV
jgi:hypothetical protein